MIVLETVKLWLVQYFADNALNVTNSSGIASDVISQRPPGCDAAAKRSYSLHFSSQGASLCDFFSTVQLGMGVCRQGQRPRPPTSLSLGVVDFCYMSRLRLSCFFFCSSRSSRYLPYSSVCPDGINRCRALIPLHACPVPTCLPLADVFSSCACCAL